jgi:hypothetical protein
MENKWTIEGLQETVAEILEGIKSGVMDLENANAVINNAELIAGTFVLQMEYHKLREEQPDDDLPSQEEIGALKDLVAAARKEIERRTE